MDRAEAPCSKCGADKQGYGHRTYCRGCWREYQRSRTRKLYDALPMPAERVCAHCGTAYSPKIRNQSRFCSPACHDAGGKRRTAERVLARKAESPRWCAHCGSSIPPRMRADQKFCTRTCQSAAHQLKRRLRADGYLRLQIAERDQWRCGICRQPVDSTLRHPDPGFGSLDHVIPKARGGSHNPSNLRLVHLVCNLRRGVAFDAAELALGPRAVREIQQLSLFDFEEDAQPV